MNILLLTSHSIAEYDDLRMLHDLGYDVFSIGAYTDPSSPTDDKRPALPDVPYYYELHAACERQRASLSVTKGDPGPRIDWAKAQLHPDIIDWADTIIVHHFPEHWIAGQWNAISHKRVIWRTCGQSSPDGSLERLMDSLPGLQIVRYSPNERYLPDSRADAMIRFGKYPDDYGPWVGDWPVVGNITQHMKQRGDACGYPFWKAVTDGSPWPGVPEYIETGHPLPTKAAGPGSEDIGGLGCLDYPAMLDYLRHIRAYLYTGTRPASYTLGLIEAMLSGVPTVSIGAAAWGAEWGGAALFEADILTQTPESLLWDAREGRLAQNDPGQANRLLNALLKDDQYAHEMSIEVRHRAIELFSVETVGPQWKAFLG